MQIQAQIPVDNETIWKDQYFKIYIGLMIIWCLWL